MDTDDKEKVGIRELILLYLARSTFCRFLKHLAGCLMYSEGAYFETFYVFRGTWGFIFFQNTELRNTAQLQFTAITRIAPAWFVIDGRFIFPSSKSY